jgi:hypothetical protein
MLLPIAMLRSSIMHTSQKVGLAAVFGLVTIDIIFDILRTVYTASMDLANFPDQNTLWALLEPTIAVIVCALPCYRGFLSRRRKTSLPDPRSIRSLKDWPFLGTISSGITDTEKEAVKLDKTSVKTTTS